MTLESRINRVRYIGNGSTKTFSFPFRIWKSDQVKVFVGDGRHEEDRSSAVSVEITATGGSVTFSSAPNSGEKIVIRRNMPYIQEDDYRNGARFDAEEVEDRLDQDCAERQDLLLGLERAFKVPETSEETGDELVQDLLQAKDDVFWAMEQAGDVTGATMITAPGTTEPRSIQARAGDFINVKDFGAKGDGSADDTAAIAAAIASTDRGVVWFPHGTYLISDTLTVTGTRHVLDLDGGILKWAGEAGKLMVDIVGNSCGIRNGSVQGALSSSASTGIAGVLIRLRGYWPFAEMLSINYFSHVGVDIGADSSDYDTVSDKSSICASLTNINISNSISTLPWAGEGGATGIRCVGFDNFFSGVNVLRCHHDVENRTGGHRFVNCHFCELPNTSLGEQRGSTFSAAIYQNPANSSVVGHSVFTNCYFDNHTYVIHNEIYTLLRITLTNCFYWCYQSAVPNVTAYMMHGHMCPFSCENFSDATGAGNYFYGARQSTYFDNNARSMVKEEYSRPLTSKSTALWTPYLARYIVQSGEAVLVTDDKTLSAGEVYCIGGVMFADRSSLTYSPTRFDVSYRNGSLGGGTLHVSYDSDEGRWFVEPETDVRSTLFDLCVGSPDHVEINGVGSIFIPFYLKALSNTSRNEVSARIDLFGDDAIAFLIPPKQADRPYYSNSYLAEVHFQGRAVMGYSNTSSFDTLLTPGKWHVRYGHDCVGKPADPGEGNYYDCVLEVDVLAPVANINISKRYLQKATVLYIGNAVTPKVFIRKGTGTSSWTDWSMVEYSS